MDRLIIEATLEDVNEITLSGDSASRLVLTFGAVNSEHIARALTELKKVSDRHTLELVICSTMVSGIYDLEIKTESLDEPVRIMNKAIEASILSKLEDHLAQGKVIALAVQGSEENTWIPIDQTNIKECERKV